MGRLKRFTEKIRRSFAKYKKPIVSLALALGIIGGGGVIYATQYTYDSNVGTDPYSLAGHPTTIKYGVNKSELGEWYYAYCTTPNKKQPHYTDYTDGGQISSTAYTILGWGHPNYSYTPLGSLLQLYYITTNIE